MIKTLAQLQADINAIYNQEAETIASTDEDFLLRTIFINKAIADWQDEPGMMWHELLTDTIDSLAGAELTLSALKTYATPTNFRAFGGTYILIRNGDGILQARVPVLDRREANAITSTSSSKPYAFISGAPGSYKVRFTRMPAEWDGYTMEYPYFKYATELVEVGDISECPDPDYIVYKVLAELHRPSRVALATEYDNKATERMEDMQIKEVMPAPGATNSLNQSTSFLGLTNGSNGSIFG